MILVGVTVLLELNVCHLQGLDQHHAVLVVDVVICDPVVNHEVFAP